MKRKTIAAVVLAVVAAFYVVPGLFPSDQTPTPAPAPADGLDLRGVFVGSTAADDCLVFGHLCEALAGIIEFDSSQDQPRLTTGARLDDLRRLAREFRLAGASIGERQPAAADRIAAYLTAEVGTDGGPVGPKQLSRWVAAYREVARACNYALAR